MRANRNIKTSKEFERTELLKLEGLEIIGKAKFTNGITYRGNQALRLLTEIKVYKPDGEILEINHLYIPTEANKHIDRVWDNHTKGFRKFRGIVSSYGFETKKANILIKDIEKDVWKINTKRR